MKQDFPNRVNPWPLNMTLAERNAVEKTDKADIVDLMFAVRELERYVIELAAQVTTVETDSSGSETTVDVSSLSSQIVSLSAQIALLPAYLSGAGRPSDAIGKNGDSYWDTNTAANNGQIGYQKMGGTWRQSAS